MGRHSAPDDDEPAVAPVPPGGSRSDLHLLRTQHGLRAQCLAALIVPFLLYSLVLVVISRTDVYLIFLWMPTVIAGATVGHLLDRAHRRTG